MQLVLFLCLLVVFHPTFGLTVPDSECCKTKSVGSVEYALANTGNTSTYGCLNDCIYTRLGEDPSSQKYCFKAGDLPVNCGDVSSEDVGTCECGPADVTCVVISNKCAPEYGPSCLGKLPPNCVCDCQMVPAKDLP